VDYANAKNLNYYPSRTLSWPVLPSRTVHEYKHCHPRPKQFAQHEGWWVVEGRLGTHEAVSLEGHEWGEQNGFVAEKQNGHDIISRAKKPGVSSNGSTVLRWSCGNQVGCGLWMVTFNKSQCELGWELFRRTVYRCLSPKSVVCMLLCFIKLMLGNHYVQSRRGASSWASQGRWTYDPRSPTSQPHPVPPKITWGVRILTRHLNCVAGYTGLLLVLWHQGLVPWQLRRLGRSKVRSASLVKVLSDDKISWDPRSQLLWNPPPPTTQSNTYLLKRGEKEKNRRRRRTYTRETKSFPFPLWTWCCWPVCDEFRLMWECEACMFQTWSTNLDSPVIWTRQSTRWRQLQSS